MARAPLDIGTWGTITRNAVWRETVDRAGKLAYRDHTLTKYAGKYYMRGPGKEPNLDEPRDVTRWRAFARYRDSDGIIRRAEAWGRTGAEAERTLVRAMSKRTGAPGGQINPDTTISDLWAYYRTDLIAAGRAPRTIDSYDGAAARIKNGLGRVRIREATTQRLDVFLADITKRHGPSTAKQCKSVLSGMFRTAVRLGAAERNPVRDTSTPRPAPVEKPSTVLTATDVVAILDALRASTTLVPPRPGAKRDRKETVAEYSKLADLVDPVTLLAATGCRVSELLGMRWADLDLTQGTWTINGHVVGVRNEGLVRMAGAKSKAGARTLALPPFATATLKVRRVAAVPNDGDLVFASQAGTLRDPDNLRGQFRRVRDVIGYPSVSTHTFRRVLATTLDGAGLTARVAADHLGHAKVSMTTDVYYSRGAVHDAVAEVVQRELGGKKVD